MSLPMEWQTTSQPNAWDIERSAVITVLVPHLVENIVGKWLWDTFGETAFYEVCSKQFSFEIRGEELMSFAYRQIPNVAPVIGR